ncbi:hypothetical protein H9Q71_011248 [Fusarium xylarioides]|nr:hypothetical protein H9Q71_011248 [Fusarium xylarioides]
MAAGFHILWVALLVSPVTAADDAEFAFNLLSDIAPILALFGDQFAKQFTSESLTWVDHLIFAMVPLGIITAITGAIRVQGMPTAKAFIGRAREHQAQAEIELMSSTSGEVCEIFNGNSIVRAIGDPKVAQFLIFPRNDCPKEGRKSVGEATTTNPPKQHLEDDPCGIHSLQSATELGLIKCNEYQSQSSKDIQDLWRRSKRNAEGLLHRFHANLYRLLSFSRSKTEDPETAELQVPQDSPTKLDNQELLLMKTGNQKLRNATVQTLNNPPNIQLNLASDHFDTRRMKKGQEIFMAATIAIILQTGLIAIAAITAYRVSPTSSSIFESRVYGFPCYAVGSLLLSLGTGLCSFVVEHSTDELSWEVQNNGKPVTKDIAPQLIWLQQKQKVSDQSFNGYVISARSKRRVITSSRREKPERHRVRNKSKTKSEEEPSDKENEFLWECLTVAAALSAGIGFTAQFMGLRGLAFPCSIAQLGAIFIMALIRAGIRRRLGDPIEHCSALQWYELDFLASQIVFHRETPTHQNPRLSDSFRWKIATPGTQQINSCFLVPIATSPSTEPPVQSPQESTEQSSENVPVNSSGDRETTPEDPSGQHLVQVRRRLGNLSRWKTRSSPTAMALVQSIELIMNTFFPGSAHASDSLEWLLEAHIRLKDSRQEKKEIIKLFVAHTDGKWKLDDGTVDAVLSLWMASIDAPRSEPANDSTDQKPHQKKQAKAKQDAWRRAKAGDDLTYSFKRVLGLNLQDGVLKRDISWWVDNLIANQSGYESSDSGGIGYEQGREIIIGFHGAKEEDEGSELSTSSEASLPAILAQHLFTSFMWTVAQRLPKDCLNPRIEEIQNEVEVEGPQTFEPYDFDQMWPKFKLRHRRLTKLVRQIESYGLGRTEDILLCMIPALSNSNLLPSQAILKRIPRVGSGHGWVETARCYKKLLDTLTGNEVSANDRLGVGIVTNTMDFLAFAWEPYDTIIKPPSDLQYELSSIAEQLYSSKFTNIMRKLSPVHHMQQRQKLFDKIFGQLVPERLKEHHQAFESSKDLDQDFAQDYLGFTKCHIELWKRHEGRNDEIAIIRAFRRHEHDAEVKDIYGWSPYHYASIVKQDRLFQYLLRSPMSRPERLPKLLSNFLRSPIHIAALGGMQDNLAAILYKLSTDSKVLALQSSGLDGMTLLHLLAKQGVFDSFLAIQKHGEAPPSLTKKDIWGRQALHIATKYGNRHFTSKLLALGSPSDELDEWGMSPIDYFLKRRKEKNLQEDPRESVSVTTLEAVSETSNNAEASSNYMSKEESAVFLAFAMEDPNCRYGDGRTFLHIAIEIVDEDSIRTLLARGFNLEAQDTERRTPLHYAIRACRTDLALTLIKGEDIEVDGASKHFEARIAAKDSHETTALMFAARANLKAVAEALLDANKLCGVDEVNDEGCAALHQVHSVEMAEFLVDRGCNTTLRDSIERTPLHRAIERDNSGLAEYLLKLKGPNQIQTRPFDNNEESILVTACQRGLSSLIIEILKVWPEIIDTEDKTHGQTPISWACELGHKDVVANLIKQRADVNKKAAKWENYTPLHICVIYDRVDILELLLKKEETKLDARSISAETPLQRAIAMESVDITRKLLLDHRTLPAERTDRLKEMVSQSFKELQAIIWEGLQTIEDQSHILDLLICLFTRESETEKSESETEIERKKAQSLLKPLARDIESKSWNLLQSSVGLNALFEVKDMPVMLGGRKVDDTGFDTDGWSFVDYIDRSQGSASLKDVVKALRELHPNDTELHRKPTALDYAEYREYIQVSPCNDHRGTSCPLKDVEVIKESRNLEKVCILSDYCIPPSAKYFYFEVTVHEDSESKILGIGFSHFNTDRDSMPGWYPGSWGYHGDDGLLYISGDYVDSPRGDFGSPGYGAGQTAGVGLNMETGEGFCTLDGKKLAMGDFFRNHNAAFQFGKIYPCVGFDVESGGVGLKFQIIQYQVYAILFRSGGHDCTGRSQVNGALTIDMRDINHVCISEDKKTAQIRGGIITRELTKALDAEGLITPTAANASVGYIGWATLGGYSPLSAKYGLGVDQIIGAQYVNAEGALVDAGEEELTAMRGGGGCLGIIAQMTIKVYPLKEILEGTFVFESTNKQAAWASFTDGYNKLTVSDDVPSCLSIQLTGVSAYCEEKEKLAGYGVYGRARTLNFKALTPKTVEILAQYNESIPGPGSLFSMQFHQDPGHRLDSVFSPRCDHYWLEIIATSREEAGAKAADRWAFNLQRELLESDPEIILDSAYLEFVDDGEADLKRTFGAGFGGLMAVKQKVDPGNVFKNTVPRL